jgi:hypothetical protein
MKQWLTVLRAADATARWHAHQLLRRETIWRGRAGQKPQNDELHDDACEACEVDEGRRASLAIGPSHDL